MTVVLDTLLLWARNKSRVALGVTGVLPSRDASAYRRARQLPLGIPTDAVHPRQADLLIVVGLISHKLAPFVVRAHAEMALPAQVLFCPMLSDATQLARDTTYASVSSVGEILPVDVTLFGCPPRQDAIARAFAALDAPLPTREQA